VCVTSIADELAARAQRFAVRTIQFARSLPSTPTTDSIIRQLVKSGTSQSANYNASRRARSRDEFIAKLGVVVEEADETEHWLAVIKSASLAPGSKLQQELDWLIDEAAQLRRIFFASLRTARRNRNQNRRRSSNS
jgi:four helix bundle protein